MSDNDATKVANNFKTLIDNYSDSLANASLTKDFVDYSDSVGELINGGCTTGGSVKVSAPAVITLACSFPCGILQLRALHDMGLTC
jgi:hypothetical protein